MQVLLDQFLDYISLERGLSSHTRSAYGSDLTRLLAFLQRKGVHTANAITRKQILDYLMWEKDQGLEATSLARRLVAARVFLRYLQQEGLVGGNVTETMDAPRVWRLLPETLSPVEVTRLIESPRMDRGLGLRDRALLELLYGTGLRVSEACALSLDHLHFDAGYLRCRGKGNKERVVPLGGQAAALLKRYLSELRPRLIKPPEMKNVFLNNRGRALDRRSVWTMIRRQARAIGLQRAVSPHTLRHSFASHMLSHDAPLRVIQEMLGHADIATTQIYTHVDASRIKSVHKKFHPRA
jgi:integrase/recombinase XerD